MTYAKPFQFTPAPALPLLVVSCSKVKRAIGAGALVRFGDLYDGPSWRQVRASGFPMTNVAAISALHGFLEPGRQIETYDRVMDEKISARLCGTGCDAARLARAIAAAPATFIVGGQLYAALARTAIAIAPGLVGGSIAERVTFATGSYLRQRAQLGAWLRANTPRANTPRADTPATIEPPTPLRMTLYLTRDAAGRPDLSWRPPGQAAPPARPYGIERAIARLTKARRHGDLAEAARIEAQLAGRDGR